MNQTEDNLQEINLSLKNLKRAVGFLFFIVLILGTVFNVFVLQSNAQLRKQLEQCTFENSQLRYERNLMDALIAEIDAYARRNPEVEKILSRYRIQKKGLESAAGRGQQASF